MLAEREEPWQWAVCDARGSVVGTVPVRGHSLGSGLLRGSRDSDLSLLLTGSALRESARPERSQIASEASPAGRAVGHRSQVRLREAQE